MEKNRLQILSVEKQSAKTEPIQTRAARRQELQATMERLWHQDPSQFDPDRDCVQRKRVTTTIAAIKKQLSLQGLLVADLGCGAGVISRALRDLGAKIHAVDIAGNALEKFKTYDTSNIKLIQDALPLTKLEDNTYDVVVCTEVIGYLKPAEYRLVFAELARIVKTKGFVICSASLDLNSDNALERFASLAETEFEIEQWDLSYDFLWMKLCHFFEIPGLYAKSSKDPETRKREEGIREGFGRSWFHLNSSSPLGFFWHAIALLTNRIADYCRQNNSLMNMLGKISQFFWSEAGVSRALFVGSRRQMIFPLPQNEIPQEMKHKRQVWE